MQVSNKLVSSIVYTNAYFSDYVSWDGGRFEKGGAQCYQMELRWRSWVRVKNLKNLQKWVYLVVYSYIECISSKNDQFVIEKLANCYKV